MNKLLALIAAFLLTGALMVGTSFAQAVVVTLTPIEGNPILTPGETGEWDAVSVRFPQIVFADDTYYLFYGTFQSRSEPVSIGFAVSTDGEQWTKSEDNPVISGDGSGFDASGVTRPVVFVEDDGTWVMYYSGLAQVDQVFGRGIGRATAPAPNGPWTREEDPVLETGAAGSWDSNFIFPDSAVQDGDTTVLYYSSGLSIGRATSEDGMVWTKDADPVFEAAPAGSWDSAIAWGSSVRLTDSGWEMFYYGDKTTSGGPGINIGYATSEDGIQWERYDGNPVIDLPDSQAFFPSFMIDADGSYRVYYAVANNSAYTEIHLATGSITPAD
jgi:predicted GH43/DUF377 family glycosyl hydrolase